MSQSGARTPPEAVVVGHVVKPHGVRGEVVVEVLSDRPERFARGVRLLLLAAGEAPRWLEIEHSRPNRDRLLVSFAGVASRDDAEALRGTDLGVDRADVPAAPDGAFYHYELLDCRCRDRRLGELGRVEEVVEDGGGLMLIVSDGERRLPIPFVREFLERVDVEGGTIDLVLPEGLVETCASK